MVGGDYRYFKGLGDGRILENVGRNKVPRKNRRVMGWMDGNWINTEGLGGLS